MSSPARAETSECEREVLASLERAPSLPRLARQGTALSKTAQSSRSLCALRRRRALVALALAPRPRSVLEGPGAQLLQSGRQEGEERRRGGEEEGERRGGRGPPRRTLLRRREVLREGREGGKAWERGEGSEVLRRGRQVLGQAEREKREGEADRTMRGRASQTEECFRASRRPAWRVRSVRRCCWCCRTGVERRGESECATRERGKVRGAGTDRLLGHVDDDLLVLVDVFDVQLRAVIGPRVSQACRGKSGRASGRAGSVPTRRAIPG